MSQEGALRAVIDNLATALRYWLPDETMVTAAHQAAWDEAQDALANAEAALETA